ncbi:Ig-like domain-containing protein [Spirosoma rhododendri]|uniref:T9SS type A sorting domain-containing protein n=1 Tax=Spirosoma rhododendri TaxID=2728024 RepID=A0A7L5DQR8_9BACT|nr:T9SS type A sorting domain-containing protein [Spirosoma rhododendri]QJD78878.1 T9SS type A sorting domain-containing protein [Spirosoma rhododendri]
MPSFLRTYWLPILLFICSLTPLAAQPTLTLYYGDPAASPDAAFDGNVLQAGSQIGDAPIYAKFGGTGTKSFQIDSPGENKTITVDKDGFFFIRPTASMVVDASKIKNFTGTVTGSVSITVKQLAITTISANVTSSVTPGSDLLISYTTGAGTFPVDLTVNGFTVNLLTSSGSYVTTLLSPADQYSGREQKGSSFGGTRTIRATIPASVSSGTYRVQVSTTALNQNVIGSQSPTFTIAANNPSITASSISTTACAGSSVSFPFTVTGGTFPSGTTFNVQLVSSSGSVQTLSGASASSPISAVIPASLSTGSYSFRIVSSTGATSSIATIPVRGLPTMVISGGGTVNVGATAPVVLTLTGVAPWTIIYTDYTSATSSSLRSVTTSVSPFTIYPTFYATTTYSATQISLRDAGSCGTNAPISGSAQINVGQTTITTNTLSGTFCPGTTISVGFVTSTALPSNVTYQAELSDANGNFSSPTVIGSGSTSPISARLPEQPDLSLNYRLRVVAQKPATAGTTDYSSLTTPVPTGLQITRPAGPIVSDVSFCPGESLKPLTAIGASVSWFLQGSTAVVGSNPIPANNQSSVYLANQMVNGCASVLSRLNVIMKDVPAAPSVSNVTVCQGGQGQFNASIPGALWYTSATGGSGSSQPPGINSQSAGDQTIYVSQTVNGCEGPRAAVKATVTAPPAAPTVTTSTVCQYATASPLTAVGANLIWYGSSGQLASAPTPSTSVPATLTYGVTQTVNGCQSAQATASVVVQAAPAMPTANPARYCVGDTPQSLTATGNGTAFRWYQTASGGAASTTAPGFSTQSPKVLTFYVAQVDGGGCESLRQPVSISVVAAPSTPSVTAQQFACQNTVVGPLSANPGTGLIWQGSGINGSTATAPTPLTTQPGTFTYLVTQQAGSCSSPAARISYTVNPQPEAPRVQSPVSFCLGNTARPLSATATGQLTWYVNPDRSGTASASQTPDLNTVGRKLYYVTQRDGNNCESINSIVEVRVANRATARITGDGNIYPGDSTALRVRLTGDGPWTFTDWTGKPITTQDSLYVSWVRPTATRAYSITNLQSACGIGDNGSGYTLTVRAPLAAQPIAEPLTVIAYPNPTPGDLTVDWSSPTRQPITLQIVDATGHIIRQVNRTATTLRQTEQFQLGPHPTGQYYLRVLSDTNTPVIRTITKQ